MQRSSAPVDTCTYGNPLRTPYPMLGTIAPYLKANVFIGADQCWYSKRLDGNFCCSADSGTGIGNMSESKRINKAAGQRMQQGYMPLAMTTYPPLY